jgi:hypothetical protein
LPGLAGANYGQTSITHYECMRAVQRNPPVMACLLDEQCPWQPQLIDGSTRCARQRDQATTMRISLLKGLRIQFQ